MFVDASAIVAILTGESDADSLAGRLDGVRQPITSAIAVAQDFVFRFLSTAGVDVVPIREREAFDRFGKGRHPAALNMGDCFAYAGARAHGVPLLFKGDDFARTDVVSG